MSVRCGPTGPPRDSLFDDASPDAAASTNATRHIVKCGGCGGAVLADVALELDVTRAEPRGGHAVGYSCRQAACVRAVAQDLARYVAELL